MLNTVNLQGRLTRDPELKRTQGGTAVCSFSLAVERDVKDQDGKRTSAFFDCVAWRGTAELLCKHFHKGSMCLVSGRLEQRDWKDKNGNNRRNTEIIVSSVYFCDSKKSDTSDGGGYTSRYDEGGDNYSAPAFGELPDIDDGELPF